MPVATEKQHRLAAIFHLDVVGYSRLMHADEKNTHLHLQSVFTGITHPRIVSRHGRIVKEMGDGILVEFASARNAVLCAVDIQMEMVRYNLTRSAEKRILSDCSASSKGIGIDSPAFRTAQLCSRAPMFSMRMVTSEPGLARQIGGVFTLSLLSPK